MLLNRTRQLYFPIRTSGGGLYNYSIAGRGIFQDSIKTIGKYAFFGLQPRAITAGNGLRIGENKDNKDKYIQKVISDKNKQLQQAILGKLLKRKKDFSTKITEKSKEILEKLIYGDGLKLLK
jgi:hypothetical protein